MSEIENTAIDGNGLNIDVRISSKSAPTRVALANAVSSPARINPATYPLRSSAIVYETARGNCPDEIEENGASTVLENVGKSSGWASQRAYASHARAKTPSSRSFL